MEHPADERMETPSPSQQDEWLWGWDDTPGIVSVWAEDSGKATVWRRIPDTGALIRERSEERRVGKECW